MIVTRGLIGLFFDKTSKIVGGRRILMGNLAPLHLHERQLFCWNLGLFLFEKLALALNKLDFLIVIVTRHRKEYRVLKAERTLSNKTFLLRLLFFDHWGLGPDLVYGLAVFW
mgnify:FL=1